VLSGRHDDFLEVYFINPFAVANLRYGERPPLRKVEERRKPEQCCRIGGARTIYPSTMPVCPSIETIKYARRRHEKFIVYLKMIFRLYSDINVGATQGLSGNVIGQFDASSGGRGRHLPV
jgi:hypothetical protein